MNLGALGGGAEIATACDWRLITKDCSGIGMVHTRMGIVPAWGASSRLAAIVGSRAALELISSGRIVLPQESLHIGLVDYIVSSLILNILSIIWFGINVISVNVCRWTQVLMAME